MVSGFGLSIETDGAAADDVLSPVPLPPRLVQESSVLQGLQFTYGPALGLPEDDGRPVNLLPAMAFTRRAVEALSLYATHRCDHLAGARGESPCRGSRACEEALRRHFQVRGVHSAMDFLRSRDASSTFRLCDALNLPGLRQLLCRMAAAPFGPLHDRLSCIV